MSYCPKCGSKFEAGKFRCSNCGSLLVYGPSNRRPSFWVRFKDYKNLLILIALAVVIVAIRGVMVLTTVYWLFIAGLLIAVLVIWLRGRGRKAYYPQQNRPRNNSPGAYRAPKTHKKATNVIPFKKKRDSKSKAE